MATNIEQIFRSFVVNKFKEIQEEKLSGENTEDSQNGELTEATEKTSEDNTICVQREGGQQSIQNVESMQSEPLDLEQPQTSALEENSSSKELKPAEVSSSDEVKKDASRKKSKKHKKHKSKKKKKKKKKEKNEKRSKSTSSNEDQENVNLEPKSLWKPAFSSPAKEDSVDLVSKTEIESGSDVVLGVPPIGTTQGTILDSVKETQTFAKVQVDIDSGFFGPKCPNEINYVNSEVQGLCEDSSKLITGHSDILKRLEENEIKSSVGISDETKLQSGLPSHIDTELTLIQPSSVQAEADVEMRDSNSNKLKRLDQTISLAVSKGLHHQSDKTKCGYRSRSKSVGKNKKDSKSRSRSKSLMRKHRSKSKSMVKEPKHPVGSKSPIVESSKQRRRSRSSSLERRKRSRSKSPDRTRQSRSSTPARYSKSPIRSWWSKSIRNRQRSRSISVRRRRSSTRSPAWRRRSRTRSPLRRRKSRSSSRRRKSRSKSTSRKRQSRSRSTSKRLRSKSFAKRRSRSTSDTRKRRSRSSSNAKRLNSRSQSAVRRRRSRSESPVKSRRSRSLSAAKRQKLQSGSLITKRRSCSTSASRRRRSRSTSVARRRRSRSKSATRRRRSRSVSAARRRRSQSMSATRKRRSRSMSATRGRRSRSMSATRRQRSRSTSTTRRRRRSRSTSATRRRRRTRSTSATRRGRRTRSTSATRRGRRSRSTSATRRGRRSRSTSATRRGRRSRSTSATRRGRRSRSTSATRRGRRSRSTSAARRQKSKSISARGRRSQSISAARRQRSSSSPTRKSSSRSRSAAERDRSKSRSRSVATKHKSRSRSGSHVGRKSRSQSVTKKESSISPVEKIADTPPFKMKSDDKIKIPEQSPILHSESANPCQHHAESPEKTDHSCHEMLAVHVDTCSLTILRPEFPHSQFKTVGKEQQTLCPQAKTPALQTHSPLEKQNRNEIPLTDSSRKPDLFKEKYNPLQTLNPQNSSKEEGVPCIDVQCEISKSEMEFVFQQPYAVTATGTTKTANQTKYNLEIGQIERQPFVKSDALSKKPLEFSLFSTHGSGDTSYAESKHSVLSEYDPSITSSVVNPTFSSTSEERSQFAVGQSTTLPIRTEFPIFIAQDIQQESSLLSHQAKPVLNVHHEFKEVSHLHSDVRLYEVESNIFSEPGLSARNTNVSVIIEDLQIKPAEQEGSYSSKLKEQSSFVVNTEAAVTESNSTVAQENLNCISDRRHAISNVSVHSKYPTTVPSKGFEPSDNKEQTQAYSAFKHKPVDAVILNQSNPQFREYGHPFTDSHASEISGGLLKQEIMAPVIKVDTVQDCTSSTRITSEQSNLIDKGNNLTIDHSEAAPIIGILNREATVLPVNTITTEQGSGDMPKFVKDVANIDPYISSTTAVEQRPFISSSSKLRNKKFTESSPCLHQTVLDNLGMNASSHGASEHQVDMSSATIEQRQPEFRTEQKSSYLECIVENVANLSPIKDALNIGLFKGNDPSLEWNIVPESHFEVPERKAYKVSAPKLRTGQDESESKVRTLQKAHTFTTTQSHDSLPIINTDLRSSQSLNVSECHTSQLPKHTKLKTLQVPAVTEVVITTDKELSSLERTLHTGQIGLLSTVSSKLFPCQDQNVAKHFENIAPTKRIDPQQQDISENKGINELHCGTTINVSHLYPDANKDIYVPFGSSKKDKQNCPVEHVNILEMKINCSDKKILETSKTENRLDTSNQENISELMESDGKGASLQNYESAQVCIATMTDHVEQRQTYMLPKQVPSSICVNKVNTSQAPSSTCADEVIISQSPEVMLNKSSTGLSLLDAESLEVEKFVKPMSSMKTNTIFNENATNVHQEKKSLETKHQSSTSESQSDIIGQTNTTAVCTTEVIPSVGHPFFEMLPKHDLKAEKQHIHTTGHSKHKLSKFEVDRLKSPELNKIKVLQPNPEADVKCEARKTSAALSSPLNFKFSRTFKPISISPIQVPSDSIVLSSLVPPNVAISSVREPEKLAESASESTKSGVQPSLHKILQEPSDSFATSLPEFRESGTKKASSVVPDSEQLRSCSPIVTRSSTRQMHPLAETEPLQSSALKSKTSHLESLDTPGTQLLETPVNSATSSGIDHLQPESHVPPEPSQSSTGIKHAFPHLSNATSKTGVKQRQYRSRSMAQESRSPSVDRGRASRSKSPQRKRRSRSKSLLRKRKSQSPTSRRRSRSKSVRRRRARSKSRGKRRHSRSKSKTRKKRSPSKSAGKRRHSHSKSTERKRRSKSTGRSKRVCSKSPIRRRPSRSRSSGRKKRSGSKLGRRKLSRSKSPVWRRRSRSKSVSSTSRSRSKSATWRHRSRSKSTIKKRHSRSSSKSTSPRRHSRRGHSLSRSLSRSSTRRHSSRSRGRWRRSRSLSTSRHRSRSTSRPPRSLSIKKQRSLSKSPNRKRRSRSQTKQKEKSPLTRNKSKSSSPPQKKVQSKSTAFKHSIGLKSLIQKQLSQAKLQSSSGKQPSKEQLPLPGLTVKTPLIIPQLPNSNRTNKTQLPATKLTTKAQLPMSSLSARPQLSLHNLTTEAQLQPDLSNEITPVAIPELAPGTQWPIPNMTTGTQWPVSDLTSGSQWTMPEMTTAAHWPVSDLSSGTQWPVTDIATGSQWAVSDLSAGSQWAVSNLAAGSQWAVPDLAAGSQWALSDLTASSQWAVTNLATGTQWAVPHLAAGTHWAIPNIPSAAQIPGSCLLSDTQASVPALVTETRVPVPALTTETQVTMNHLISETLSVENEQDAHALSEFNELATETPPTMNALTSVTQVDVNVLAVVDKQEDETHDAVSELRDETRATVDELAAETQAAVDELMAETKAAVNELAAETQAAVDELTAENHMAESEVNCETPATLDIVVSDSLTTMDVLAPETQATVNEQESETPHTVSKFDADAQVAFLDLTSQTIASESGIAKHLDCKLPFSEGTSCIEQYPFVQSSQPFELLLPSEQPDLSHNGLFTESPTINHHLQQPETAPSTENILFDTGPSLLLPNSPHAHLEEPMEPSTTPKPSIMAEQSGDLERCLKDIASADCLLPKQDNTLVLAHSACVNVSLINEHNACGKPLMTEVSADVLLHSNNESCVSPQQNILSDTSGYTRQSIFAEPSASSKSPVKAESCANPDHTMLVEPYVSPEHSVLAESFPLPNHPILIESYNRPCRPLLVEPYASPDHSIPSDVDESPDHAILEEPYARTEPTLFPEAYEKPVPSHSIEPYVNHDLSHPTEQCNNPLATDICASPCLPLVVEPYASPVRPILVEPYASPDSSPLTEHYGSPAHSPVAHRYSSPAHSPVDVHSASPANPPVDEPCAGPAQVEGSSPVHSLAPAQFVSSDSALLTASYSSFDHCLLADAHAQSRHSSTAEPCENTVPPVSAEPFVSAEHPKLDASSAVCGPQSEPHVSPKHNLVTGPHASPVSYTSPKPSSSSELCAFPTRPLSAEPCDFPLHPLSAEPCAIPPSPLSTEPCAIPPSPLSAEPGAIPPSPLSAEPCAVPPHPISAEPCAIPPRLLSAEPCASPPPPLSAEPCASPPQPLSAEPCASPLPPLSAEPCASPLPPLSAEPCASPLPPLSAEPCASPLPPLSAEPCASPLPPLSAEPCASPLPPLSAEPCASPLLPFQLNHVLALCSPFS
ncbi:Hypothetical predicted protein [Pelobates cultripes]|uniref:Uncharacterized protein n=1 Tax=Pelobates cultripes TaxID=61616 RepID=A0AAD1QXY2_PELCU|nr:Hypothetical predicted protein [Pelobates cultripes]